MERSDWLGVAAIVVAVIFGIPSLVTILSGHIILASILLVLTICVAVLLLYIYRIVTTSPFIFIENNSYLKFRNADCTEATLRKEIKISPRLPGQEYFTFRNISCDGAILNFRVDPWIALVKNEKLGGDYFLTVKFPYKLRIFKTVTTWIEFDLDNCFPNSNEGCIVLIDQPTKNIYIQIDFHENKLPENDSLQVVYRYSGKDKRLGNPTRTGNSVRWNYSRYFRRIGYGEYDLMWRW